MENAEEILQCLDEFAKLRPKEIPPELEYYLSFVARTGDPVYQWPLIKSLFREKLINVITEFYEACPSVEIPPCPNVEIFNYEAMKGFILEKLDTFAAAPFTVQRICELLTSPRKEYNRIDKYMRALEKNILVVSTREPGNRKSTENGESIVNGLESEHDHDHDHDHDHEHEHGHEHEHENEQEQEQEQDQEMNVMSADINVEVDMDEKTVWHKSYESEQDTTTSSIVLEAATTTTTGSGSASLQIQESYVSESKPSSAESVITSRQINYISYTTNEITTTTEATPDNSSTTTNKETAPQVLQPQPQVVQPQPQVVQAQLIENSETVFSSDLTNKDSSVTTAAATATSEGEDEHIYVTESVNNKEPDCSPMETNQIICAETEPITPPEPEAEVPETTPEIVSSEAAPSETVTSETATSEIVVSTCQPSEEEGGAEAEGVAVVVESSSEVEASITSTLPEAPEEVEALVIGPEDMQVEDISPEPETKQTNETNAKAETTVIVTEAAKDSSTSI